MGEKSFWLILWVFLFIPTYTLWVTSQDFTKLKTILGYISVVNFISIAFMVVKLKNFKVSLYWFSIHEMAILGGFLGRYSPKYCSILLRFWSEVVSNNTNTVFKKSFKNLNFSLNGRHPKSAVQFQFGAQFNAGKPKILLKTKHLAKNASLGISNSVSSRSQNNHRVLVKLNKKVFWGGAQTGSKLLVVAVPKGYQKFSHSLK